MGSAEGALRAAATRLGITTTEYLDRLAGESVERVAARVGRSCAAVADVLRQAGHEDLARQFDLAASRQKRAS